jgi:aminopeptidase-like protein
MMELIHDLYPQCRSITGDGVRSSLQRISQEIPLEIIEVPSGTQAFDWVVPDEWNIREAYIETLDGQRIVDFADSNLHVLNYSCGIDEEMLRTELDEHLYSLPEKPEWIPYRTSYYSENWGFCLSHNDRESMRDERYRVRIDADLAPGSLTYGELYLPGQTDREVVLFTHICHPSLCNDNLSGIAVLTALGRLLGESAARRYSYRLVFAPGTIGSIVWLSRNQLDRVAHGLVIGLLGDEAAHTYKRSRRNSAEIDRVAEYVIGQEAPDSRIVDFSPYGYDERQFGSPGIDLPVGRLTRSANGEYPEYHTSADNLEIVSEEQLQDSSALLMEILATLELNQKYENLAPFCEPQLARPGLYRTTGGEQIGDRDNAMLWLLNQSDGRNSLLDIAVKSDIPMKTLGACAKELQAAGLLKPYS